jgi:hypothetical protein
VVGKYPYFVEVGIDFFSAGATAGQPFNRFSVAFRIERAMKAPDEFLGALAPKMPFGTTERRCEVVEEELQKKISEDIDTVHDLTSFKILRERYSDENTLTITLRVRNLL